MTDAAAPKAPRLASIDAYRGFVMLLMMAEVLELGRVAKALPGNAFWSFLAFHQSHVPWTGCSLHDLIQPSFTFLVGVALPFSLASRASKGQDRRGLLLHAAWRALVLVLLGIFLRSIGKPQTNFTFDDTLTQIGLGYFWLVLLELHGDRVRLVSLGVLLLAVWLLFAMYPLPGPDFDWKAAGVPKDWPHHATGFAAHWNKNTNAAWAFDRWWMNLFPRPTPFLNSGGGYATLSFLPTLGTMILGGFAGAWMKADLEPKGRLQRLVGTGLALLAAGWLLGAVGVCPVVKRIWTPSWVLFSGGWCFLLLAGFHAIVDVRGWKAWAFPLLVIGANSIAAYCMDWLFVGFLRGTLRTHLGAGFFKSFGAYEPLAEGAGLLLLLWLMLFWMWRRKLFLKV
jgi:predicted acyltransferase